MQRIIVGCVLISMFCLPLAVFSQNKEQEASIDSLAWLKGSWSGKVDSGQMDEHWSPLSGNSMLGVNRIVRDGETVHWEFLRIEKKGDSVYLTVLPVGQKEVAFRMTHNSEEQTLFENPEHDFPKKIGYGKGAGGKLIVMIEGEINEKFREREFHMDRME